MKWILLATFLVGAVAAVILIRFFRRSASGRGGPVQIRIDSDKLSVLQKAALPEEILEELRKFPERAAPQPAARSGAIVQTQEKDSSAQPPPDLNIDKNVQFSVYRPNTIVPNKWYPLVAFAHLSKRRPDAPKDEPDPVEEVRRQAVRILSDQPAQYESAKLDRGFSVPRRGLLTFVPLIEGCEFNPPTQSVLWQKTVHKVEFEMMASADVDGKEVEGQMTVYLGNIVLTEIPLRISVDSQYVAATSQPPVFEEENAEPYRKIFASYSHQDTEIVEDFEAYVQALGDQYLRDVQTLRSGEVWSEALERMIREATVFQLFWSSNSMRSKFVKQEWEYALALNKPGFIRPVYWEEPLPQIDQDLPPAALRRLHFYKFPEIILSAAAGAPLKDTLSVGAAQGQASQDTYCTKCGAVNDSTAQYCVSCQAPLSPVGGYQPLQTIQQSASAASASGFERLDAPRSRRSKSPLLAMIAFVAIGSVAFLGFQFALSTSSPPNDNTNSSSNYNMPPAEAVDVDVYPTLQLQARGDSGEYSLLVRNLGSDTIGSVMIAEQLPKELEYVTSDPQPSSQEGPQLIVWRVPEISGNNAVTIRITIRLRRKLKPGETITTKPTVTYIDQKGEEKTLHFSPIPVIRARTG
ncbi:MAG TPA: TIR domain-containing protein [Pyrinomonadaceae bacterium]